MKSIEFLKYIDRKYPLTLHDSVGFVTEAPNGTYIESDTVANIKDIHSLKECTGLHKSKRVILLVALKVIRLMEDDIEAKEYKQKVYGIKRPKDSMIEAAISLNTKYVLDEIVKFSILSSAGRFAQLKVEYPFVFNKCMFALEYFGREDKSLMKKINRIINSSIFLEAYKNLRLLKNKGVKNEKGRRKLYRI